VSPAPRGSGFSGDRKRGDAGPGSLADARQADRKAHRSAWYGGEEAGTAIAATLAGVSNPAGRLPVTFYRSVDQLLDLRVFGPRRQTNGERRRDPRHRQEHLGPGRRRRSLREY
jgi:hypothetical protein